MLLKGLTFIPKYTSDTQNSWSDFNCWKFIRCKYLPLTKFKLPKDMPLRYFNETFSKVTLRSTLTGAFVCQLYAIWQGLSLAKAALEPTVYLKLI